MKDVHVHCIIKHSKVMSKVQFSVNALKYGSNSKVNVIRSNIRASNEVFSIRNLYKKYDSPTGEIANVRFS